MTNQQHLITLPPGLVQQWANESPMECSTKAWAYELFIAHHAVQWGADQELEACIAWFDKYIPGYELVADRLRAARRPKPLSLKEQALAVLEEEPEDSKELIVFDTDQVNIIRRALEQLDD